MDKSFKKNLSNKTINKSKFNFIINEIYDLRKEKKKYDFLIYYRAHNNIIIISIINLIKKLINLKFKIFVVGDKLELNGVKKVGLHRQKK